MSIKRKHRVVVEITLEQPDFEKRAKDLVMLMLNRGYDQSNRAQCEVTKWDCKQFSKVVSYVTRNTVRKG
jgi:hypothetical protein